MGIEFPCLSAYEQEADRFAWWASLVPGRLEQVNEDVQALQQVGQRLISAGVAAEQELRGACDAAFRLRMLAYEGNMVEVEAVFAAYYEVYYSALFSRWGRVT